MKTMTFKIAALAGALALFAGAAHAGGFWIECAAPDPKNEKMKGAALVIRAEGCHGPGASLTGTAEGIVDGKRKSIKLKLKSIGDDTFTVTRQWPKHGRWALAITATAPPYTYKGKTHRIQTHAVVELTESGTVMVSKPNVKEARPEVVVRRPNRESLAQLVEKTLKDYGSRRASL